MVFLGAMLLSGCTAVQFTYNNAESLARYFAWDYVEPDAQQSEALQQRVVKLQQWHRANELPVYASFLDDVSRRAARGVTRADVEWVTASLRSTFRRLAAMAAEEASPILVTLTPQQLDGLERRLAKDHAKYTRDWLSGSPARRERRAVERMVERFEDWTGDLEANQRVLIEKFVRDHPRIAEVRLEDRKRWQRLALEDMRRLKSTDQLAPRLVKLFSDPDATRSDDYRNEEGRWESDLADLIVAIDKTLTDEQRALVQRRISRYANDFRELARGPRRAPQAPGG